MLGRVVLPLSGLVVRGPYGSPGPSGEVSLSKAPGYANVALLRRVNRRLMLVYTATLIFKDVSTGRSILLLIKTFQGYNKRANMLLFGSCMWATHLLFTFPPEFCAVVVLNSSLAHLVMS